MVNFRTHTFSNYKELLKKCVGRKKHSSDLEIQEKIQHNFQPLTYMNCSNLNKPSGRLFYVGTKRVGAYSRVGTY